MCQVEISIGDPNFDPGLKFRSGTQISIRDANFDPKPKFRSEMKSKFRSETQISFKNRNFDVLTPELVHLSQIEERGLH